MKAGSIILIDDDVDDKDVFIDILRDLRVLNPVVWFQNCADAFSYLKKTDEKTFIIFCDVNLPGLTGIECKGQIDKDEELRKKSIPFVFCSTSVNAKAVDDAYTKMTVQGFFKKKNSYNGLKQTIKVIVDYWDECEHPNSK